MSKASATPVATEKTTDTQRMYSSELSRHQPSATGHTLKALCFRIVCVLYSCLLFLCMPSNGARLRCGSDLLADLIFVCGDRGIYLGKGNWSGYGTRPRGKGIVDHCCQPAGCDLQHLELYCAKPKKTSQNTTAQTTTPQPTTPQPVTAQQFQDVFQKKVLEHLGAPNSEKRDTYRKKTQGSLKRRNQSSSSRTSSSRNRISTQHSTTSPTTSPKSLIIPLN